MVEIAITMSAGTQVIKYLTYGSLLAFEMQIGFEFTLVSKKQQMFHEDGNGQMTLSARPSAKNSRTYGHRKLYCPSILNPSHFQCPYVRLLFARKMFVVRSCVGPLFRQTGRQHLRAMFLAI